jgi:hypothetical protein
LIRKALSRPFIFNLGLMVCFCLPLILTAQSGISGKVTDDEGNPLGFASIYNITTGNGLTSNAEGNFAIQIEPGTYEISFRYLGFETVRQLVIVNEGEVAKLDIQMKKQAVVLQQTVVGKKKEDPAYTIMRKAIAKSKYHQLQCESYKAKVYIKGTAILKNIPRWLKKTLEADGIKDGQVFTLESVSEVYFKQPNVYKEKVIAIKTRGMDSLTPPNQYINASFYEPMIGSAVSPLSPSAFYYYKFVYSGGFTENNQWVNKIRVVPKSPGEQVFEGYIYIIEDLWSIHSVDLKARVLGIDVSIKQIHAPVFEHVRMPVNHTIRIDGKVMGLKIFYAYNAVVSNYKIEVNNDLVQIPELIDENVEEKVPVKLKMLKKDKEILGVLSDTSVEISRKDFRKLINEYEKQQKTESENPELVVDYTFEIDSLANKADSAYWEENRPFKLTKEEELSYQQADSAAIEKKNKAADLKKKGANINELVLFGKDFKTGEKSTIQLHSLISKADYNLVEGLSYGLGATYLKKYAQNREFTLTPNIRHATAINRIYGTLETAIRNTDKLGESSILLKGGRIASQFNNEDPIDRNINGIYSLYFRRNFIRLYEKRFLEIDFIKSFSKKWDVEMNIGLEDRHTLENQTDYSVFYKKSREFESNLPQSANAALNERMLRHQVLKGNISVVYRPGVKYALFNGKKIPIFKHVPEFRLNYEYGQYYNSVSDHYQHVSIQARKLFKIFSTGRLSSNLKAGTFLQANPEFPDLAHFSGNQTVFTKYDLTGSFRLLEYYAYSTSSNYLMSMNYIEFRKLLLTRLPLVNMTGIRENLFVNILTIQSPHYPVYYEFGYSVDQLFRILRVELAVGFKGHQFFSFGPRIGVAAFLDRL